MFAEQPVAIIDIGSNSVRLVVYSGATRIPSVIFNEKVLAGLGRERRRDRRDRAASGGARAGRARALPPAGQADEAWSAPAPSPPPRCARPRTAPPSSRGSAELGLEPRMLSGEEEGKRAGQGVLSAIPDADGIVGDLGGGSLELVEVARRPGRPQRLAAARRAAPRRARRERRGSSSRQVAKAVAGAGFEGAATGRPFYLVGGSWRALARLDMALTGHPLPITHQHVMPIDRPADLKAALAEDRQGSDPRHPGSVSLSRFPTLPNAEPAARGAGRRARSRAS